MKDISEVWEAYRELVSNPDVTAEGREAFWEELAQHFPKDAVPGLRRSVEFFFADDPSEPGDDPSADILELLALWGNNE